MSKIEKLFIQGIRSFGDKDPEVISFNTPLTLIVGYNGSGKTTIIECLKYATTGDLPPNSKGGAFIHEPNLIGEKLVDAQVKLSFRSTIGESFVVRRMIELTVKKKTRTQKTKEVSLSSRRNGERIVLSTKVADLDALVPEKLGVSPAILDAVIFCHQDESLWPMSEPSVLKKRFDEIFEAQRYTKAIENIMVIRKKHGDQLSQHKINEKNDKINKEKCQENERKMSVLQEEIEAGKRQYEELTREKVRLEEQAREKREGANSFLTIVNDLDNTTTQLRFAQKNVDELRNTVEEMQGSDKHLEDSLVQYEEKLRTIVADQEQKAAQFRGLKAELQAARSQLTAKASEKGKHQSDKDKYDRQLVRRVDFIHDAASRLEIRGFDGDLDDSKARSFGERVEKTLADKRRDVDRRRRDNKQELDQANRAISDLEGRKHLHNQDRLNAKKEMARVEAAIADTQKEVNSLEVDEGSLAVVEANIADLNERHDKAKAAERDANLDHKIQQEDRQLKELQLESSRLNQDMLECNRLATERAELDIRKKEFTERSRDLTTLIRTWSEKLSTILGRPLKTDTLETDYQKALSQQNNSVAEVRQQKESAQQELKNTEYSLSSLRERQKQVSNEMERAKADVTKAVKSVKGNDATMADYLEELEVLEADHKQQETDLSLFDELKKFYQSAQDKLDSDNKCQLCNRDFQDQPAARAHLVKRIARRLSDDAKTGLLDEMKTQKDLLNKLRQVRPQFDKYQRLQHESPATAKEIQELVLQSERLVRQLEDKDSSFREASDKLQEIESINKTVSRIGQLSKEVTGLEKEIERLASQPSLNGPSQSAEEIRAQQNVCGEQIMMTTSRLEKLKHDRQSMRDVLSDFERQRSELKTKLSEITHQVQDKRRLEKSILTMRENHSAHRATIQGADKELEALEPELAKAKSMQEDIRQRGEAKEQKLSEEVDKIWTVFNELKRINVDIQEYIDRGGPANLASNVRAIESLEATIANLDKESTELSVQINQLVKQVDNADRQKKNIRDNLSLRRNLREIEELQQKAAKLETRNARADYERLMREAKALDFEASKVNAESMRLHGQCHAKDSALKDLVEDYEKFYSDARNKYRESQIKVETTRAAMEDLYQYKQALETAVMEYHRLKMVELNRIAGELWQSTYQGTDIDTIKVESDSDGASSTSSTRKSYNYRVCMVKGDTQMDMRGRCSAGQKVLASIIIRLALAESFGVNCGVIALDEPTTNLDSDNIRSLAESLHSIIKNRQQQVNLQLVVITHDEEFLKHMQCSDFCDDFFRVKRDEKQNSVIVRESITRVMEA